jgi:hypothetical protein
MKKLPRSFLSPQVPLQLNAWQSPLPKNSTVWPHRFGRLAWPKAHVALSVSWPRWAQLAVGAAQLYKASRWYAGAALVRQLIEVEYLLFLFATDDDEPEQWLNASDAEAKKTFSPSQMRERSAGRFLVDEYQTHCKIGGHPRVSGHLLLNEHITPINTSPPKLFDPSIQWVDLAQHLERLSAHYMAAVARHSPTNVYPDRFATIAQLASDWRTTDPDTDIKHI